MAYYRGRLIRTDGSPIVPEGENHNCYYPSGWNRPYTHAAVATILTNAIGDIAAVVARKPDEPAEGGKLALPGGYVELGQILAAAAETEVLEETGYAIVPRTLGMFAMMDGPKTLPGRQNEDDHNIVMVYSAQAGPKVQEHDDEVTGVYWISQANLPPREDIAFGHYDIMGMWFRHLAQPFAALPIVPSGMKTGALFLPSWPLEPAHR
jgi:ADP-ribose pyrophosphatase YjhB (NUDIX family)